MPIGYENQLSQRHRPAHESGKVLNCASTDARHRLIYVARQYQARIAKELVGIRPPPDKGTETFSFREGDRLAALQRLVITTDLGINSIAEPESLVPELGNIFCLALVLWRIEASDCLEQAEGNAGVDGPGHFRGGVHCPASAGSEETYCNLRAGERLTANFPVPPAAQLLIGVGLAAVMALLARSRRLLSSSGVVAALVVATPCVAAGWDWVVILVSFFVSATALSKTGEARKQSSAGDIVEKGSERDARQVLANGGTFAVAAAASLIWPSDIWQLAGAGSIAAATADTWATEIGILSKRAPRSIVSWNEVEPGTSGGVTMSGTLAAFGGAAQIALIVLVLGWPIRAAYAAIAGGVAGATIDSIIGGSIQARRWCTACQRGTERAVHACGTMTSHSGGIRWLHNDLVNLASCLCGAIVGLACLA
jgi:uncharacterized protein (TIGR00297 family)